MSIAREECFWYDQCGSTCSGRCQHYYTPEFEEEEDEKYYHRVLLENAEEYQKVIDQYSDGRDFFESERM